MPESDDDISPQKFVEIENLSGSTSLVYSSIMLTMNFDRHHYWIGCWECFWYVHNLYWVKPLIFADQRTVSLVAQIDAIIKSHSRCRADAPFHFPPEARYLQNRNPASLREPMQVDGPLGPRTTPLDINFDELDPSTHIRPFVRFVCIHHRRPVGCTNNYLFIASTILNKCFGAFTTRWWMIALPTTPTELALSYYKRHGYASFNLKCWVAIDCWM